MRIIAVAPLRIFRVLLYQIGPIGGIHFCQLWNFFLELHRFEGHKKLVPGELPVVLQGCLYIPLD